MIAYACLFGKFFTEMVDELVPAAEAQAAVSEETTDDEIAHYECAFHILPTVAEEEVSALMERVKALIAAAGGVVAEEELAGQVDLAYEIAKETGGSRRRFNAAHFCWVRFTLAPSALSALAEEVGRLPEILRHLVVRLTAEEIQKPHFARAARQRGEASGAVVPEEAPAEAAVPEAESAPGGR